MLRNMSGTLIPVQSESEDFMGGTRDPRTKIDRSRTEDRKNGKYRTRLGQDLKGLRKPSISEKARTNSDQDQIFSENFKKSWTGQYQNQLILKSLGGSRIPGRNHISTRV